MSRRPAGLPEALVFDWDNTLVDTWVHIRKALNHTLEAMGHEPWTLEETRQRVRASARDTFPALFGARAEEAIQVFYEAFEAGHLANLNALPGAEAALRRLAEAGVVMAVVSNKQGRLLRREAEHIGWNGLFHRLVGATDAARDKPAPDPVILALEDSGVAPGPGVWFVGDTDMDMVCARNAGCRPVLLRREPPEPGEFDAAEPDLYVESWQALAERALNT
jgi:phosphoglycolate phosphatase